MVRIAGATIGMSYGGLLLMIAFMVGRGGHGGALFPLYAAASPISGVAAVLLDQASGATGLALFVAPLVVWSAAGYLIASRRKLAAAALLLGHYAVWIAMWFGAFGAEWADVGHLQKAGASFFWLVYLLGQAAAWIAFLFKAPTPNR